MVEAKTPVELTKEDSQVIDNILDAHRNGHSREVGGPVNCDNFS